MDRVGDAIAWLSDFRGRESRLTYGVLLIWALAALLIPALAIHYVFGKSSGALMNDPRMGFAVTGFLDIAWAVAVLVAVAAASVRRLHDQGDGAKALLVVFFPFVGWVLLAIFLFGAGDEGPNDFGPDPLAPPVRAKP